MKTLAHPCRIMLKQILEKMGTYTPSLYGIKIHPIESHNVTNKKLVNRERFSLWHDRLGHPSETMMRKLIGYSHGHPLKDYKIFSKGDLTCTTYPLGKLITRPSITKLN